ncbi:abortive infection family protein [Serratia marcescens]|uniref:abortive infection family protein n=1 Tax=Serratia TaxID=613 RepID=UPI003836CE79
MLNNIQINALGKILSVTLEPGDWKEIFTVTGFDEYDNDIFMNDVIYNNGDLSRKCMEITSSILEGGDENINHFWKLNNVPSAVRRKDPELHRIIDEYISGAVLKTVTDSPVHNVNENIYNVLKEADTLIQEHGPENAYDRMHTALHATLEAICKNHHIPYTANSHIQGLLTQINTHLKHGQTSDRNEKVFEMLKSCIAILDKVNYLRNHYSNAHPTEVLLNKTDAKFAINLVRSIMSYVDELLG